MDRILPGGERAETIALIDDVQFAIRGAASIRASSANRSQRQVIVATGPDADTMLDAVADLISHSSRLSPEYTGVAWSGFLRHIDGILARFPETERRKYIHNALVGLRGEPVNSIAQASNGAVMAMASRDGRSYWLQFNRGIEQDWGTRVVMPRPLMGQPAIDAAGVVPPQSGPIQIAGNYFHGRVDGLPTEDRTGGRGYVAGG